jgi:uncharacterized protein (TIGR03089 family)
MESTVWTTVVAAFDARVASDAASPLITFYDDASGDRTEVSGATMGNWVAKTANLIVDGLGLGPGELAAVNLPAHWQTAAVLLGCWSAGLVVDLDGSTDHAAVAFTALDRDRVEADEVLVLALAPMAAPVRPGPPVGSADYVLEVRRHGDQFTGRRPVPASQALAGGATHAALVERALGLGLPRSARVLVDGDITADPAAWLVAPLCLGTSVVLCRNLDPTRVDARLAAERATPYP